jgi:DNA-binding transcriptional regulator YiaG
MRDRPTINTEFSSITANEFMALAEDLGMSSRQIAKFFGIDDDLVRRWLRGTRHLPVAVVMTLELMRHFKLTPEEVRQITGEEEAQ